MVRPKEVKSHPTLTQKTWGTRGAPWHQVVGLAPRWPLTRLYLVSQQFQVCRQCNRTVESSK